MESAEESHSLLEQLYSKHNFHFSEWNDLRQRTKLQKEISQVLALLPSEVRLSQVAFYVYKRSHFPLIPFYFIVDSTPFCLVTVPWQTQTLNHRERAFVLHIRGKALNAYPIFDANAYECLSKSVCRTRNPHIDLYLIALSQSRFIHGIV